MTNNIIQYHIIMYILYKIYIYFRFNIFQIYLHDSFHEIPAELHFGTENKSTLKCLVMKRK